MFRSLFLIRSLFRFFAATLLLCTAAGAALCQEGQWETLPSMGSMRKGGGAAAGPDGRIHVIGGTSTYGNVTSMQIYDPRANTWTWVQWGGVARSYFGCVTGPDGRMYILGGTWSAGAAAYDFGTARWSGLAPLPIDTSIEVVHSAAVGNDGRIYVLVEPVYPNPASDFPPYLRAYDIAANTWSEIIDPPVTLPHMGSGFASDAAGRIHIAGGETLGIPSADVFIFDPQANTWKSAQPMPNAGSYFHLLLAGDGLLHAIGSAYDPAQDAWSRAQVGFVEKHWAATTGLDGRIYIAGGEWPSESAYAYQPERAPRVTAASISAVEGTAFTGVVAGFTDTVSTIASDFSATIHWGDGQTSSGIVSANGSGGGFNVTGTHLYTKAGSYVTRITVRAALGRFGSASGSAAVAGAPLTAAGLNLVISSKTYSGPVATFTDSNPYSVASDFTATIRWGDGTSSAGTVQAVAGGGFRVSGAHTYRKWGTYAVSVIIADAAGSATAGTTLRVVSASGKK